jgi:stearoyl-CoA desaturase (delta-9 desaturase)
MYFLRMFGITAGYHRYFSHRSYKTSRAFQFVLAWLGAGAFQKGPLWWAARHRHHHQFSDQPEDVHSPLQHGLWRAHISWIFKPENDATDESVIRDLTRYPEIRFLDRYYYIPPLSLALLCYIILGASGVAWGFLFSTIILYHGTFTINSLSHVFGSQRYVTDDTSKNNIWLALLTMGEGWHNNHHYHQVSARQGFFWWEIDASYYILKLLSWLGVVWRLNTPSSTVRDSNRLQGKLLPLPAPGFLVDPEPLPLSSY